MMNHFHRKRMYQKIKRSKKRRELARIKYQQTPILALKDLCQLLLDEIKLKAYEYSNFPYNYRETMREKYREHEINYQLKLKSYVEMSEKKKCLEDQKQFFWTTYQSTKYHYSKSKKIFNFDSEASNPILLDLKTLKGPCMFFEKTGQCQFNQKYIFSYYLISKFSCDKFHHELYDSELMKFNITEDEIQDESKIVIILKGIYNSNVKEEFPDYDDFYKDVFNYISKKYGPILGMRTCKNLLPHLRGNVYIEFPNLITAEVCFIGLRNKVYTGALLIPEIVILKYGWKGAICGQDHRNKCPRGDETCNYLHVYINPGETRNELLQGVFLLKFEIPIWIMKSHIFNYPFHSVNALE